MALDPSLPGAGSGDFLPNSFQSTRPALAALEAGLQQSRTPEEDS